MSVRRITLTWGLDQVHTLSCLLLSLGTIGFSLTSSALGADGDRADVSRTLPQKSSGSVKFNRDIRPILSDKCFQCHGTDAIQRKAKLRLDTAQGAYGQGASGSTAIVPGKLDESELYQRIISESEDERMPPKK